jgi:hypothetical protein
MTEDRLRMIEQYCHGAGGKSEHAWRKSRVQALAAYARDVRRSPPGHEPVDLLGPVQNYMEVVSPAWVLELVAALREARKRPSPALPESP